MRDPSEVLVMLRRLSSGLLALALLAGTGSSVTPSIAPAQESERPLTCVQSDVGGSGWTAGVVRLNDPCADRVRDLGQAWR